MARKRDPRHFLIEGPHVLEEALLAGVLLDLVMYSPRGAESPVLEEALEAAVHSAEVSDGLLEYAADSQHPQGILAIGRIPAVDADHVGRAPGSRLVVLEEIRDPGNLGTIARTCRAAFGEAVVLAGNCVDAWNPKVVRASAGALFSLPILRFAERTDLLAWLEERGVPLVAASATATESCFEADLRPPVALLLGSEAHGVSRSLARECERQVQIPMAAGSESLNLAAAAAVLLYASVQQERAIPVK